MIDYKKMEAFGGSDDKLAVKMSYFGIKRRLSPDQVNSLSKTAKKKMNKWWRLTGYGPHTPYVYEGSSTVSNTYVEDFNETTIVSEGRDGLPELTHLPLLSIQQILEMLCHMLSDDKTIFTPQRIILERVDLNKEGEFIDILWDVAKDILEQ